MKRKPPNWKTRLTVTKTVCNDRERDTWNSRAIKFSLEFDKKPKGFSKRQGHLVLNPDAPHLVRLAQITRHFHHCNMGYALYTHALNKLGELSTEYNKASAQARKLWRRLMNDFEHEINDNVLIVYNKRIRTRKKKR